MNLKHGTCIRRAVIQANHQAIAEHGEGMRAGEMQQVGLEGVVVVGLFKGTERGVCARM
jgi:hypothetical protein